MTEITTTITVAVRFFAAARAAAGTETATLTLQPGATLTDAICELSGQSDRMALVLRKCSFLCDGVAIRDSATVLQSRQTLDVLPPFAGG
ncbi:MAG: MoaD/ThiS family protein [Mycobacterium sp.]|nr:MoaD/ThiS family protein [Mycobacterium sp.]